MPKASLLPPKTKSCENYLGQRMNNAQNFLFSWGRNEYGKHFFQLEKQMTILLYHAF